MFNIVILAAGVGSRLQHLTESVPKAVIRVNQKSILQYQLEALKLLPNINRVYIVTGYLHNLVQQEINRLDSPLNITLVENTEYLETNNMFSLMLAMNEIGTELKPLIVLNGDVIYDNRILLGLVTDKREDLIAVDIGSYLPESMKVTSDGKRLLHISKSISKRDALGVSIDLYKLSINSFVALKQKIEVIISSGRRRDWTEVALDQLLKSGAYPAEAHDIMNRSWWEIDNLDDLRIAEIIFRKDGGLGDIMSKEAFVFDLDGTLILGDKPTEHASEFLELLRKSGKRIVVITNNSSRGIEETRALITRLLGVQLDETEIFSSTHSTIQHLKNRNYTRVYTVGTDAFVSDLEQSGIMTVAKNAEAVVIGFDTELTYEKLRKANLLLRDKKYYVATHSDLVCPTDAGFIPDAGSLLALFQASSNREPDAILGKPNPVFLEYIAEACGVKAEDIAIFGDRLYTDIRMGLESNCLSVLVLTGETRVSDLQATPYLPQFVFHSVGELYHYWIQQT